MSYFPCCEGMLAVKDVVLAVCTTGHLRSIEDVAVEFLDDLRHSLFIDLSLIPAINEDLGRLEPHVLLIVTVKIFH